MPSREELGTWRRLGLFHAVQAAEAEERAAAEDAAEGLGDAESAAVDALLAEWRAMGLTHVGRCEARQVIRRQQDAS